MIHLTDQNLTWLYWHVYTHLAAAYAHDRRYAGWIPQIVACLAEDTAHVQGIIARNLGEEPEDWVTNSVISRLQAHLPQPDPERGVWDYWQIHGKLATLGSVNGYPRMIITTGIPGCFCILDPDKHIYAPVRRTTPLRP